MKCSVIHTNKNLVVQNIIKVDKEDNKITGKHKDFKIGSLSPNQGIATLRIINIEV